MYFCEKKLYLLKLNILNLVNLIHQSKIKHFIILYPSFKWSRLLVFLLLRNFKQPWIILLPYTLKQQEESVGPSGTLCRLRSICHKDLFAFLMDLYNRFLCPSSHYFISFSQFCDEVRILFVFSIPRGQKTQNILLLEALFSIVEKHAIIGDERCM